MARIAVLPSAVADQIAAGEVVERPASIVKELVENALDAGATSITVELEDGGRAMVRVSDDGVGMDREDAVVALERHATSKIQVAADLIGIPTFGFRGEALPAIASVSQLTLETMPAEGRVGTRVIVRGGLRERVEDTTRARGTMVEVHRLFFNTPVRAKFLRSTRSEVRAAVEALVMLAMTRLDVAFRLVSDGRVRIDAPRVSATAERLRELLGRRVVEQLVPVEHHAGYVSVRGFVQRPADARPTGRKAYLFVNGRAVRDPFLVRAAEAGYRATIPAGCRPTVFLEIGMPGDRVDVNVHPTKREVKFRDRSVVERAVEDAVRHALGAVDSAAVVVSGPAWTATERWREAPRHGAAPRADAGEVGDLFAGAQHDAGAATAPSDWEPLQVFDTYIVFGAPEGVTIVDQHAAHERVLYEEVMARLRGAEAAAQRLLLPVTVDLEREALDAVEEHREALSMVGYEVEPFGGRSVVLHAVPNPHPRFDAKRCFEEVVSDLARERFGAIANRLERFAATYACRAAIMAGHRLERAEMRALLSRLFACTLPPHDVHGRPGMIRLPRSELERRFGRA